MSITNHNGTITLTSFAELREVLDARTFPDDSATELSLERDAEPSSSLNNEVLDLATVITQLATLSTGVETMAREDARVRGSAALELAHYETLLEERADAERALGEARRVRGAAERLAAEAFSEGARAQAAHDVAAARSLELHCLELLTEHNRAIEELASRPHLARALADRRRLADEEREAARRANGERADRLASGLAAIDRALSQDDIDEARSLLEPLAREFPNDSDVRRKADTIRWRLRNRLVAPAEAALRDISRPPYRDDPEATMQRLAEVHARELPDDLARRVFGLWSNACYRVVQRRGWQDPRRKAPLTSRGSVWARPEPVAAYVVVSSLDEPTWKPGDKVPEHIATRAPALKASAGHARESANTDS